MNIQQAKAARQLKKALEACHEAGLQGGVFSCSLCVWPVGRDPFKADEFFSGVKECGGVVLNHEMHLDGGAGN